jgi:glycerophosphoryl diester phosphodiesterase
LTSAPLRYAAHARQLAWLVARPIAHRGRHDSTRGIVENTASAFAAAIEGDYAIECDIQITADGEAAVFHDETLGRLTERDGPVRALSMRDLRSVAFRRGGDRMQSLGELLDQVRGRVPLVVEIKSRWTSELSLARRAMKLAQNYPGPLALMSFDPRIVACLAREAPTIPRGIVADRTTDPYYAHLPLARRIEMRHFTHLPETRPHFVSFEAAGLPFAPVGRLRARGMPVISWTIRSPAEARHARRYSDQITFEGFAP